MCLRFPARACHGQLTHRKRGAKDQLKNYFAREVMIASATFLGASL